MAEIFISYAREDREHAKALAGILASRGWSVWWDRKIPVGKNFSRVLEEELHAARAVVVLWSSHSIKSEWVENEASDAAERGVLVPVMLEEVRLSLQFRRIHAAHLVGWQPGASTPDLEDLFASLTSLLGAPVINSQTSSGSASASGVPPPDPPAFTPAGRQSSSSAAHHRETAAADDGARAEPREKANGGTIGTTTGQQTSISSLLATPARRAAAAAVAVAVLVSLVIWRANTGGASGVRANPDETATSSTVETGNAKRAEVSITILDNPSFRRDPVGEVTSTADLRLTPVSSEANKIIDEKVWFSENALRLPLLDRDLPACKVSEVDGLQVLRAIGSGPRALLIYGPDYSGGTALVACDVATGEVDYALDFSKYRLDIRKTSDGQAVSQRIGWAQHVEDVLYVSYTHDGDDGYARSAQGMTGYVSAIDPAKGRVVWQSAPLVSNARNFEVVEDYLITGYGFTAEPDFLYVLRRENGEAVSKIPLKSGPEFIIRKDNRLYLRTYDTNYVFNIARGGGYRSRS